MKPSDWYALQAEVDEPTLTRTEALERPQDRPAPSRPAPSLMRSFRLADERSRAWMTDAACKGLGADLFFPDDHDLDTRKQALEVCKTCPVLTECDDYANGIQDGVKVAHKEYGGVWAGTLRGRGVKSDKPLLVVCSECGEPFTPKWSQQSVCSQGCKRLRHNRQQVESYRRRKEAS